MIVLGDASQEEWPLLVQPDDKGPWALRYVWFKHERNDEFVDGYFSAGTELKLNMRKLTADLAELWKPHNDALREAAVSKAIVYRVKVLNKANRSIDHVEVWRSPEKLHEFMHSDRDGRWPEAVRQELGVQLRAKGFIIKRVSEPYPLISKTRALAAYTEFAKRAGLKDSCNLFTPLQL